MSNIYYPVRLKWFDKASNCEYCVLGKKEYPIDYFAMGRNISELSDSFMDAVRKEKVKVFAFNYTPPAETFFEVTDRQSYTIGFKIRAMSQADKADFEKSILNALRGK